MENGRGWDKRKLNKKKRDPQSKYGRKSSNVSG